MAKKYEIIAHPDCIIWEVRDEAGKTAIVKTGLTLDEADTLERASRVVMPPESSNVRVTPFISRDPTGLPAEIPTHEGVLIMGKGEGVPLHRWHKPIPRRDWESLREAIIKLNANDVYHCDLKEDHLMVREQNGRICFDIIDWGAQKYCSRIKGKDINDLDEVEASLIERKLLEADKSKPVKKWRRDIPPSDQGIVLE
jgi:hypothetical protein